MSSIESAEEPTVPPSTSLLAGIPRTGIRRAHQPADSSASPLHSQRNLMQQIDQAALSAPLLSKQQPPHPSYPAFQPGRSPISSPTRFPPARKSRSPEYDNIPSRQSAVQRVPTEVSTVPVVTFKNVSTRRGNEVSGNYSGSVVVDERQRQVLVDSPAIGNNNHSVNVQRNTKPASSISNSSAATESYGSLLKKSIESQRR